MDCRDLAGPGLRNGSDDQSSMFILIFCRIFNPESAI
jgi:hypothetical protein